MNYFQISRSIIFTKPNLDKVKTQHFAVKTLNSDSVVSMIGPFIGKIASGSKMANVAKKAYVVDVKSPSCYPSYF